VRPTWRVAILLSLAHTPLAWAQPVSIDDIVRESTRLEGASVTVLGTLTDARTHLSKRGERQYSFQLNDRGRAIAVVSVSPPGCPEQSRVAVTGIVQRPLRLDATRVVCVDKPGH